MHGVSSMGRNSVVLVLGLVLCALAACDSGSGKEQAAKEHVWKGQSGAIDKAREVETILQRSKENKEQEQQ